MIRWIAFVCAFLICVGANAQSAADAVKIKSVATNVMDPDVERQCGMSMRVPDLRYVYDQPMGFGCTGSYENGGQAVLDMDIQYDPNQNSGGARISFVIENVGIDKKISDDGDGIFFANGSGALALRRAAAYGESNCGPVTDTKITPIHGANWHGWVAEETFGKVRPGCKPLREFTKAYRCVHVMVGNDAMTAQLTGVCLLRKREFSLENGLSYDLFLNMMNSLRFVGKL
ncbi:hypothetical protein [Ralstonia sp. ASV6]|uniref:hypothetical protein n=1 Tax=Ralstonia sp. ASV6 TaxID=2795124 RepID=UPI0018EB8D41|nr:hypothetical protein [Ralstonia sp. ASV6]